MILQEEDCSISCDFEGRGRIHRDVHTLPWLVVASGALIPRRTFYPSRILTRVRLSKGSIMSRLGESLTPSMCLHCFRFLKGKYLFK